MIKIHTQINYQNTQYFDIIEISKSMEPNKCIQKKIMKMFI
jgi:hypothetical protein